MIKDQGKGNLTMGQRHARMQMAWAMAAAANDSGNSRDPEGTWGREKQEVARGEIQSM